ncbi:protein PHTF2-like isoform X1 [Daphnia pulicaria]|nr:protein PHTF2-like isoform X1 [Daphnia pulicaria]XP_046654832.1 protein PHTF2-like isoform X1 [Daphnia pulicaria]
MALNQALCWYQHKIGAYDKQIWEETVEQRILHGLSHVPKKSGKLKLDYIDLDVVRGSSFPKAKPKHGLVYLSQLCVLRLLFLPFHRHWWIQQTSCGVFQLLLILYGFQMVNMVIYFTRPQGISDPSIRINNETTDNPEIIYHDVSAEEVLVPVLMMCILSLLLSQMVSTQANTHLSPRRPKSKLRTKRTKRRVGRRIGTTPSDSKSSLENVETQSPSPPSDQKPDDIIIEPKIKKRSFSEERQTSRVKIGQRSSSLQLDSTHVLQQPLRVSQLGVARNQQPVVSKRKAWFFSWPVRLVVPNRVTIEDEGFDSFHGNNSSSSDCENEENALPEKIAQLNPLGVVGLTEINADDKVESPTENFKLEINGSDSVPSCSSDSAADGQAETAANAIQPLLRRRRNLPSIALKLIPPEANQSFGINSEMESERPPRNPNPKCVTIMSNERRCDNSILAGESSYQSSCESDGDAHSSIASPSYKLSEPSTPLDWTGVTTNSEECSYSSESRSESDENETNRFASVVGDINWNDELAFSWEAHGTPTLSSSSDKVSCTVWEGLEVKKADLSVLDVAAAIIAKVDVMPESTDYLCGGLVMAGIFALLPIIYRINSAVGSAVVDMLHPSSFRKALHSTNIICNILFGSSRWEKIIVVTAAMERFAMAAFFLFLLAVAERTFKQRFLYAKLFSHLTSSRRARNSDLPHFRLNKVRNIKTWLSVRSYLKKRGPQRSVDCIVSAAFIITLCLVSFLCMELLKESQYLHQSLYNLEVLCWCLVLGVFLLRFMTLGSKINKKYRNLSVLITEQINLYLQMEQKPDKKEELMLANNVLKLAADLLKELESPFKISGLSANPYLYNLTKVVVLSALSGVLSEMLGFKLKLHKIKIR